VHSALATAISSLCTPSSSDRSKPVVSTIKSSAVEAPDTVLCLCVTTAVVTHARA
jgi:hypothetical protein